MILSCLLASSIAAASPIEAGPVVVPGQPAATFVLPDTSGKAHDLAALAGKTVVLEWFNPDCPFVKYAYGEQGPIPALVRRWQGESLVWLRVNSGAPGKQGAGAERNTQAIADWSMEGPVLLDETGAVGKRYGAKTTPQIVVIAPSGIVAYNGALDNAPMGRAETEPRLDYVDGALSSLSAGKAVDPAATRPYGCSVKYPD